MTYDENWSETWLLAMTSESTEIVAWEGTTTILHAGVPVVACTVERAIPLL